MTDRPTTSHEHVFLLTKRATYWYDAEAVREPHEAPIQRYLGDGRRKDYADGNGAAGTGMRSHARYDGVVQGNPAGRNKRTVWTIPTQARPEAHFAAFPDALAEVCVKSGCPPRVCPACGAPWTRTVEKVFRGDGNPNGYGERPVKGNRMRLDGGQLAAWKVMHPDTITGWSPGCAHNLDPVPGITLDPFVGRGTSVVVANRLGRRAIGFDLSPTYVELARRAVVDDCPMFNGTGETLEPSPAGDGVAKQDALGLRTYTGFNARWKARQDGTTPAPAVEEEEEAAQLGLWQEAAG